MLQPRTEDQWDHHWTWVLGCNGNGCLAAMEHEAGIEQISGLDLDLGVGLDLGIDKGHV